MKVLHITPLSNGYEEVELIANNVSKNNGMAVIKKNGELLFTGGFLLNDTKDIRNILDSIPKEKQYDFVRSFKMDPFADFYYEK